jgi:hypothetical protein
MTEHILANCLYRKVDSPCVIDGKTIGPSISTNQKGEVICDNLRCAANTGVPEKPELKLSEKESLETAINLIATAKEKLTKNPELAKNLTEAFILFNSSPTTTIDKFINEKGVKLTIDDLPFRVFFGEYPDQTGIAFIEVSDETDECQHKKEYAINVGYKTFPDKTVREPLWGHVFKKIYRDQPWQKNMVQSDNKALVEEIREILRKI